MGFGRTGDRDRLRESIQSPSPRLSPRFHPARGWSLTIHRRMRQAHREIAGALQWQQQRLRPAQRYGWTSLGRWLTRSRMSFSERPLRTRAANPRNTNGMLRARKAKMEKPVALDFSMSNQPKPRTQKNCHAPIFGGALGRETPRLITSSTTTAAKKGRCSLYPCITAHRPPTWQAGMSNEKRIAG